MVTIARRAPSSPRPAFRTCNLGPADPRPGRIGGRRGQQKDQSAADHLSIAALSVPGIERCSRRTSLSIVIFVRQERGRYLDVVLWRNLKTMLEIFGFILCPILRPGGRDRYFRQRKHNMTKEFISFIHQPKTVAGRREVLRSLGLGAAGFAAFGAGGLSSSNANARYFDLCSEPRIS